MSRIGNGMGLRLYNTLTRRKDLFSPIDPDSVGLYVCGPTVYDRAHIGNARPVLVFDVLFRLLRHTFGDEHVRYVRNITDVDDKINARAAETGISIRQLTDQTALAFGEDVAALGCLPPTVEPRATDHIAPMIEVTRRLVEGGHAYVADGHVLFDVASMPDYGALSRRSSDELLAGARVEVAPYKRGDADFVLWKPAAAAEPGWPSPWGRGRPGWHIECSAMSWTHLGEVFDIHGGGLDLIFPHHENEIAQTRCAFGHGLMATVWLHNGFLQVEGEKMSKSLGNFITIHDLLATSSFGGRSWPGEVLRLAMLRTHYRQPIDWTVRALEEAERTLDRWYDSLAANDLMPEARPNGDVLEALEDDLNTPAALMALHGVQGQGDARALKSSAALLGLLQQSSAEWRGARERASGVDAALVERLVASRLEARRDKNWAESDRIRDVLAAQSITLKDNKDGTTSWTVARKQAV